MSIHAWSVSTGHRARWIGLPYAFVMDGGVVQRVFVGLTHKQAEYRAARWIAAIDGEATP